MTHKAKSRLRLLLAGGLIGLIVWPALAIPPIPPRPSRGGPPLPAAQTGSKVSTYNCGSDVLVLTETWDYSVSSRREYVARVNGKKLSNAHAKRVDQEIALGGPFQTNSAYCTSNGFDLTLYRYTPTAAELHLVLKGRTLSHVGLSNTSTSFKLNHVPVL